MSTPITQAMHRSLRLLLGVSAFWLALAGNAAAQEQHLGQFVDPRQGAALSVSALIERMQPADVVLLGEVHDHPQLHAQRAALLRAYAAAEPTRAVTLLAEHFDLRESETLALAQRAHPRDPQRWIDALAEAQKRWPWSLLLPAFQAAVDAGWPVLPSNLSATELRNDRGTSLPPLSEQAQQRLQQALIEGHCNALPAQAISGITRMQRLRDAGMARALLDTLGNKRQPILLAGNGHVRKDFGVPQALQAAAGRPLNVLSIGFLEANAGDEELSAYDIVLRLPPHPRPDPCASFKPVKPAQ